MSQFYTLVYSLFYSFDHLFIDIDTELPETVHLSPVKILNTDMKE